MAPRIDFTGLKLRTEPADEKTRRALKDYEAQSLSLVRTLNELNDRLVSLENSNPGQSAGIDISGLLASIEQIKKVYTDTREPTGFPTEDKTNSSLSITNSTRTFTISAASPSPVFNYYIKGKKYQRTSDSIVFSDIEGLHFIYYDANGALQDTTTFTNALITDYALVCAFYWSSTLNDTLASLQNDERHGIIMDGMTHLEQHKTKGAYLDSITGFAITGTFTGDGSSLDHSKIAIAAGATWDEDIYNPVLAKASPAQIPIYYRDGASGVWKYKYRDSAGAVDNYPVIYSGSKNDRATPTAVYTGASGRLPYNKNTAGTWSLTELGSGNYVCVHIFVTTDHREAYKIIGIQGQVEYTTIVSARAGAASELNSLVTTGLPVPEMVAIATLMFQTKASYVDPINCRLVQTATGEDYVNWCGVGINYTSVGGLSGYMLKPPVPVAGNLVSMDASGNGADSGESLSLLVHLAGTETITGNKTLSGTINYSALTASRFLSLDSSKNVVTLAPDTLHQVGGSGEPSFSGTWTNFNSASHQVAAYIKLSLPDGIYILLQGLVKSGTIGTTIFTLPTGYRPAATINHATVSNAAFGEVNIGSNGTVVAVSGNNAWFSLSGIIFKQVN